MSQVLDKGNLASTHLALAVSQEIVRVLTEDRLTGTVQRVHVMSAVLNVHSLAAATYLPALHAVVPLGAA